MSELGAVEREEEKRGRGWWWPSPLVSERLQLQGFVISLILSSLSFIFHCRHPNKGNCALNDILEIIPSFFLMVIYFKINIKL